MHATLKKLQCNQLKCKYKAATNLSYTMNIIITDQEGKPI